MKNKIINIMSDIFDIKRDSIKDSSSINNIEKWDSLTHLNMIISLEKEFNIEFSPEETVEMITFKKIFANIKSKN
jgi:acyl carrier protein